MATVQNILNIGYTALQANQIALNVTGNNIANVNTEGYSRQNVRFGTHQPVESYGGHQIGAGVYAAEIERQFNRQLENTFLQQNTDAQGWTEQSSIMGTVETFFNEQNAEGTHSQLTTFLKSWGSLSTTPDHLATREAILSQAQNLTKLINSSHTSLTDLHNEMLPLMINTTEEVNRISQAIADVNVEIAKSTTPTNNANTFMDRRDSLVRELSQHVNVVVKDRGPTDFSVYLVDGMPLVEDESIFTLSVNGPHYENGTENFKGTLQVDGADNKEYSLDFVNSTEFRVSFDAGKSWVSDDSGETLFTVPPSGEKLKVKELTLIFEDPDLPPGAPLRFEKGDSFYIVPKVSIFWNSPTRDAVNLSTSKMEELGGKLGAYVSSRDNAIGETIDRMDAFAETLIWELNYLHSQGAGIKPMTHIMGNYTVKDMNKELGDPTGGLAFSEKLKSGNLSMYFTDTTTGEDILTGPLHFETTAGAPLKNFDPQEHSLLDVVSAINRSYVDPTGRQLITASLHNGAVQLTTATDVGVQMGTDTSGLLAALGINTFFSGSSANDISINQHIKNNTQHINASSIDGSDEATSGDGTIASRIAQLATIDVEISTKSETREESLLSYYAGTVGTVASKAANANYNASYYNTLAKDTDSKTAAVAGVNLDQEMTLMIRYQHSYTSAAKLITTANEMFETLLSLKQ